MKGYSVKPYFTLHFRLLNNMPQVLVVWSQWF